MMAFLRGLEKAPTFLVPIINPPFADNSPHLFSAAIRSLPSDSKRKKSKIKKIKKKARRGWVFKIWARPQDTWQ